MKVIEKGHITLGVLGLLLTFYFSLINNTWVTALFWSIFGFIFFFLAGCGIRYYLKQVMSVTPPSVQGVLQNEQPQSGPFQSIALESLHQKTDSERITDTIRSWTNEDREG